MTPHRCPVCNGSGLVLAGFYSPPATSSLSDPMCRSCNGSGVLWEMNPVSIPTVWFPSVVEFPQDEPTVTIGSDGTTKWVILGDSS